MRKCLPAAGLLMAASLLSACGSSSAPEVDGGGDGAAVYADFHTRKTPPLAAGQFELLTLSTLPDAVTGGDVLLALRGLAAADSFRVSRNGDDVTAAFVRVSDSEARGLVGGLDEGANTIAATVEGAAGKRSAQLRVIDHPITGPVISGPHQTPFLCRTVEANLGEPLDADCSIATRHEWYYRSVLSQGFEKLADPYAAYPADTLNVETFDGRAVPYVVRVESATINRGIARIAVLDDPHARGPDAPFAPTWNRRVYYVFGESCGVGYHQGLNQVGFVLGSFIDNASSISTDAILINLVGIDQRLGQGDVVVHSTLSAFGNHCNPMISIETAMMVKEHITEQYGLIDAVVGTNGSGAALQQYNAANNAPGLINAAMPTATFADILSTAMTVGDCGLLVHYYEHSALDWNDLKRAAVNGHNLLTGTQLNSICQSWVGNFLPNIDPAEGCSDAVPRELRYDPANNPGGVRCTLQDGNVNIYGRDPATGFARRPLDNVGVQYGLQALRDGAISAAEFVDLNRNIGGFDIDGHPAPERMVMAAEVERRSYQIGGVIGRGALAETPVMDLAPYLDLIPSLNIHEAVRPFTVRARLRERSGQDATQSIWRGVLTQPDAYPVMEQWFVPLQDLPYGSDRIAAITAAKPAAAQDRCVIGTLGGRLELPDALLLPLGLQAPLLTTLPALHDAFPDIDISVPLRIDLPEDFDSGIGVCSIALPVTRTPRMVAGMPMSDDIIKCQLKPLDRADYPASLDDAQFAELQAIFPGGVCDFSKPAAGDVARSMIWPSIGGTRLEEPHELKWRVARSR